MLAAEFRVLADEPFRLNGSGMILINPPWQLDIELAAALPWLWQHLAVNGQGGWRVDWLTGETPAD
jgi:23S rRNA (adenine2030-N6)-methyltransferase